VADSLIFYFTIERQSYPRTTLKKWEKTMAADTHKFIQDSVEALAAAGREYNAVVQELCLAILEKQKDGMFSPDNLNELTNLVLPSVTCLHQSTRKIVFQTLMALGTPLAKQALKKASAREENGKILSSLGYTK
jgi:hypothetical protein